MSRWRVVVREIHRRGPLRIEQFMDLHDDISSTLYVAKSYGLLRSFGTRGVPGVWSLTPKGLAWAERRIEDVRRSDKKIHWQATWLSALPRGIRLGYSPPDVGVPDGSERRCSVCGSARPAG